MAETVRTGLHREGWAVDVASTGTDGLWMATGNAYDAIVLDIMLPGLSGYEVVRQLRGRRVWTPVLMLTAKDGEFDLADALDLGADDYLTKPFSFVVLTARLRALQRRGAPERPAVISVGTLDIDPAAHTVTRSGTPVSLTAKEFAVLEVLARHAGDVVTKREIITAVWDMNYDGDDNIVEVYVAYLRRKIDQPFGLRSIGTVRGVGYRLTGGS